MPATANYGWVYPVVGANLDDWGDILNASGVAIDAEMFKKANANNPVFTGNATITGSLTVTGIANLGATTVNGNFSVTGSAAIAVNLNIGGNLAVTGITDVTSIRFPNGDVVTNISSLQTPWKSSINANGFALDRVSGIGIGAPSTGNGVLVAQPGLASIYIRSADAAPTGTAVLYLGVAAGATAYWQISTGGNTTGDLAIQHSDSGATIQVSPQGRFRIGVGDDGSSTLQVGGAARVTVRVNSPLYTAPSIVAIRPGADSVSAIQFQNAAGAAVAYIDTALSQLLVGGAVKTSFLLGNSDLRIRPGLDGATAIRFDNAAGTAIVSINTVASLTTFSGNVGIGVDPGFRLHVGGGRAMCTANNEAFALGLGYGTATPVAWMGCRVNGDIQISEAGGSVLAVLTQGRNWIQSSPAPLDFTKLWNGSFSVGEDSITGLRFYCRFSDGIVRTAVLAFT